MIEKIKVLQMKNKMHLLLKIILLICVLTTIGCNRNSIPNSVIDQKPSELEGDDVPSGQKTHPNFLYVIPEEYRYMFEGGICEGEMPSNEEIKKIALFRTNSSDDWGSFWLLIYGVIDLDNKEMYYGINDYIQEDEEGKFNGNEYSIRRFELSDEDVEKYKDSFNPELFINEANYNNSWWKIAVEYKDGTCYSYEFHAEAYSNDSPQNELIKSYFDKLVFTEEEKTKFVCFDELF